MKQNSQRYVRDSKPGPCTCTCKYECAPTVTPFHVIGCNLEWWERLDLPQPGQRRHQWYNQFVEMNASPTFAGWHNRREPCPGTFTARITDMPSLSGQNATGRQNIFIAIKVSGFSAGSCQPKDHAYVHVNLQIVRGN